MFTQRISMDCSQEQYEKYLKAELEKMGYSLQGYLLDDAILVNNSNGENGQLIMLSCNSKDDHGRTYLGKFNANLFLALAAMRDEPFSFKHGELIGGYGEYLFSISDKKLYRIGDTCNCWGVFRKATVSEIMAKFGEQPKKDIYITLAFEKEPIWENCEKLIDEYEAIHLLKTKGYRIFKQTTTLEEV